MLSVFQAPGYGGLPEGTTPTTNEHLNRTVEEIDHDPTTVIDGLWRPIDEDRCTVATTVSR